MKDSIIRLSQRAIIAIHVIDYMIRKKEKIYIASDISNNLGISYNHLSKILQILAKHGYLKTYKGPLGGYILTEKGKNAKISEIIELVDGKISYKTCLMSTSICEKKNCSFKKFIKETLEKYKKLISLKINDI